MTSFFVIKVDVFFFFGKDKTDLHQPPIFFQDLEENTCYLH